MEPKEIKEKLEEIESIKKARELAGKINEVKVAMLTTLTETGHTRNRPMQTHPLKDDGILWFITSKNSRKVAEILAHPEVSLSYTVPEDNLFVSINGTAMLSADPAKLNELWSPMFRAWFPKGTDDPDIALLQISISHIEYWDAPDSIVAQLVSVVKATLAGNPYAIGEHKDVDF